MVKNIDYEIRRGDTYQLKKFRILDSNGQIINLTDDVQLYFTLKTDSNTSASVLQKTINNGIELGEDGYYHITIEPGDTNKLNYQDYVYDIQLKATSPKVYVKTLIEGTITITSEVTWEVNE